MQYWVLIGIAAIAILAIAAIMAKRFNTRLAIGYSEETYHALITHSLQGIFVLHNNQILLANPTIEYITGYTQAELQALSSKDLLTMLHPDDRLPVVQKLQELLAGQLVREPQQYRFTHKNGATRWCIVQPTLIDYLGKPVIQIIVQDTTEQVDTAQALRQSNQNLASLIENADVGIWSVDTEYRLIISNRLFQSYIRIAMGHEWLPGEKMTDIALPGALIDDWCSRYNRAIAGESFSIEVQSRYLPGMRIFEYRLSPIRTSNGTIVGATIFGRDITGVKQEDEMRRKLEAQLLQSQKMEAIGQLAGGIAHDFNNILVPITGYTDLVLMNMQPGDDYYEDLQHVRESASRASNLTRQILAFSRQQVLDMRTIDLNDLAIGFQRMLQRLIGEHIELDLALNPKIHRIKADAGQIEQVLLNLVINARDAMPQGGKLILETDNAYLDSTLLEKYGDISAPGQYVLLAVSDTGHGMDAETQQHIFEPFFTTKDPGKGTGLGLATVFGIVKQHNGYVRVYSEPGKGTTFKIYLPSTETPVQMLHRPEDDLMILHGTETILVVEDDALVRQLVCETLNMYGYTIIAADNPTTGLRYANEHPASIDLLLTDVILPEMNGYELYQQIATISTNIQVLYTSGYTNEIIGTHGILDEDTNFLQKPFTVHNLVRKVRQVLNTAL